MISVGCRKFTKFTLRIWKKSFVEWILSYENLRKKYIIIPTEAQIFVICSTQLQELTMKLRYFTRTYEKLASFRTFKKYFTKTYEKLRLKSLLYELYEQKVEPYEIPNLHPTKTTHSSYE